MKFLEIINNFNIYSVMLRIVLAAIIGGFIGAERGRHGHAAGLRTHLLVCVGSAISSLTSLFLSVELGFDGDVARLSAQVISGIGFLGAGMILIKNKSIITGLTTAAGLWVTATLGIAVGYGFYAGAGIGAVLCVIAITFFTYFEGIQKHLICVYVEVCNLGDINTTVTNIKQTVPFAVTIDIVTARSKGEGNIGMLVSGNSKCDPTDIARAISQIENVAVAVETSV